MSQSMKSNRSNFLASTVSQADKKSRAHKKPRADKRSGVTSRVIGGLVLAVAIVGVGWYFLADSKIRLSETGYELSKALYAACNLEDPRRLDAFVKTMEQHSPSPEEQARLAPIIELAQRGHWQDAAGRARKLLQSQDEH